MGRPSKWGALRVTRTKPWWSAVAASMASRGERDLPFKEAKEGGLWARVEARCAHLETQRDLIRSHTLFPWWPGGC